MALSKVAGLKRRIPKTLQEPEKSRRSQLTVAGDRVLVLKSHKTL